jgi:hypothetical protein
MHPGRAQCKISEKRFARETEDLFSKLCGGLHCSIYHYKVFSDFFLLEDKTLLEVEHYIFLRKLNMEELRNGY